MSFYFDDLSLSEHFIGNWVERVGGYPTIAFVRHILKNAVLVQKGRVLRTRAGAPYSTLSIYWYPHLSVIVKVDSLTLRAVTVLTPQMANNLKEDPHVPKKR